MKLPHLPRKGDPRFPDGEQDLWPIYRAEVLGGASVDTPAKRECENRRGYLIDKLRGYAGQATPLYVTRPQDVRIVGDRYHDIWAMRFGDNNSTAIQVPRHVVAERPGVGQDIRFRSEVPAFVILGSLAHELAHRDRALRNPERHRAIFSGFRADNRHELDLARVQHEEIATDVDAYALLRAHDVPFTPEDYLATVPPQPGYHQELALLIKR